MCWNYMDGGGVFQKYGMEVIGHKDLISYGK